MANARAPKIHEFILVASVDEYKIMMSQSTQKFYEFTPVEFVEAGKRLEAKRAEKWAGEAAFAEVANEDADDSGDDDTEE